MAKIILNKETPHNSLLVFDLETDVLAPLRLGYYREAVARLDSIFDRVLGAKLMEKYSSAEARELIRLLSACRLSSSLILLAYKSGILTRSQKSKLEEFKSIRNAILHDSFGELKVMLKNRKLSEDSLKTLLLNYIDFLKSLISDQDQDRNGQGVKKH